MTGGAGAAEGGAEAGANAAGAAGAAGAGGSGGGGGDGGGAGAGASATGAAAAGPGEAGEAELLSFLRKRVVAPGEVMAGSAGGAPRVVHTVATGDTHASIAAAYLDVTEIYREADLAKALEKASPSLAAGTKVEIPAVLTRAPRSAAEERLGWPEDRALRALFMTGPYAQQRWTLELDKMVPRGLNAVVLDAKDYMGPMTYPSRAAVAVEVGATAKPPIPDLARMIRFAHARGIRIILRIPCFHDPYADRKAKGGRLSLKHPTTGAPVHIDWLDPTNTEAQDYALDIAREGLAAGADEINLDYVRFPVHIGSAVAKMPEPHARSAIIRDFVRRVHALTREAGAKLSIDLFGVTATGDRSDIERLGQEIATVGPAADAIMPMVYPSHYDKGYNGWEKPGDHPEIVGIGTRAAVKQLASTHGTTVVRSWLQAFAWRTSIYGSKYVVDQAHSAETNGGVGWAMWSPACEYSAVYAGIPPRKDAAR